MSAHIVHLVCAWPSRIRTFLTRDSAIPPQDIVIRGHAGNLVLHESDEGRKRAGLAPRRRNSNLTTTEVSVPTLKATLLLKNPLEEEVVVYWRSVDQDSYVKLVCVSRTQLALGRYIRRFAGWY